MDQKSVRINLVGDILLHSRYDRIAEEKGPHFVFAKCGELLGDADLRFGNLECVLSNKGVPNPEKGCLRGDPRYIEALRDAGFGVLSLANNHALDFGTEALVDMACASEEAGIRVVGGGRDLAESRRCPTLDVKGVKLGFLAYSARDNGGYNYAAEGVAGVAPLDLDAVVEDITNYKELVDHLILSLHWGIEYSLYPTPDQVSMGRKFIDAGASLIVGHHPRILQGHESYKHGVILYSIGNLCHSDLHLEGPTRTYKSELKLCEREAAIYRVSVSKERIEKVDIIPLWLNDEGQPEPADDGRAADILKKIAERSEVLTRADFAAYWESMLIKKRVAGPLKVWWESGNLLDKLKNFKLSQIQTLWVLCTDFIAMKFSSDSSKWQKLNPRNDKKPRPFCGHEEE